MTARIASLARRLAGLMSIVGMVNLASMATAQPIEPKTETQTVFPQPLEPVTPSNLTGYDPDKWTDQMNEAYGDPEQKTAVLASRWLEITWAAGHVNVISPGAFRHSVEFWSSGALRSGNNLHRHDRDAYEPMSFDVSASVTVRSDNLAPITIKQDADLIHIYGDLRGRIEVTGDAEIIIGGDIHKRGEIISHGSASIFVGGDVHGPITIHDDGYVWIHGDHHNVIYTGNGKNRVTINGAYKGTIEALDQAAVLFLTVESYMHSNQMRQVAGNVYESLFASVGHSELRAGYHPRRSNPDIGKWLVRKKVEVEVLETDEGESEADVSGDSTGSDGSGGP